MNIGFVKGYFLKKKCVETTQSSVLGSRIFVETSNAVLMGGV
jgi:hypothetical protein